MSYTKFTTPKQLIGIAGNAPDQELIRNIPIVTGTPFIHKLVYQESISDVKAGDILYVHADWEASTEYAYNLMVMTYLVATTTTDFLSNQILICEKNGRNINNQIHHEQTTRVGMFVASQDYEQLFISFCAYGASTAALPGHTFQVEPGYGRLTIHHYR